MSTGKGRVAATIALGLFGVAILGGLGTWQVQRLAWKEALIAELDARLTGDPIALPRTFEREAHEFRRIRLTGHFTGETGAHGFQDVAYLMTKRPWGAGYRVIQPFETTDGRVLLVERGYVPLDEKNEGGAAARSTPAPDGELDFTGALRWPDDADGFNDLSAPPADNVWLTREVPRIAPLFGAEPVLVVADVSTAPEGADFPIPLPVTVDLPNDHLQYAVTWFSMAAIWAGFAVVLVRRARRRARG